MTDCIIEGLSSRVCDRGTRCCVARHDIRAEIESLKLALSSALAERDAAVGELTDCRVLMFEAERQRDELRAQQVIDNDEYESTNHDLGEARRDILSLTTDRDSWRARAEELERDKDAGSNPCGEPGCGCTECRLWAALTALTASAGKEEK